MPANKSLLLSLYMLPVGTIKVSALQPRAIASNNSDRSHQPLAKLTAMKHQKTHSYQALAQTLVFRPAEAVELFPADGSQPILFYPHEKMQLSHLIARYNLTTTKPAQISPLAFRCCQNLQEICCFVDIEQYGSVKLVRDQLGMNLVGSVCWQNRLWHYFSLTREDCLHQGRSLWQLFCIS